MGSGGERTGANAVTGLSGWDGMPEGGHTVRQSGIEDLIGAGVGIGVFVVWLAFVLGVALLIAFVAWRITAKTGYPGVMGLLYFVPIANLVLLCVLAFSQWPIEREIEALRAVRGRSDAPSPPERF